MLKCFRISNDAFMFISFCQTIECNLSIRFCVILCRRLGSRNGLSSVSFVLFTVSSQRNCIVFVACVFEFQLILGVQVTLRNHDLKQHFLLDYYVFCVSSRHSAFFQHVVLPRIWSNNFILNVRKHVLFLLRLRCQPRRPRADEHTLAKSNIKRKTTATTHVDDSREDTISAETPMIRQQVKVQEAIWVQYDVRTLPT